jgi:DNA polymerase IIIc chi subunit
VTEIKFFFNVDDKLGFACKLAKKAYEDGRKLIVYAGRTSGGQIRP